MIKNIKDIKILTILGARPQFIKSAPIAIELKNRGVEEIVVHTGQHFDKCMSEIFFKDMNLKKPKYNLNINSLSHQNRLDHGSMVGKMCEEIEKIVMRENPDMVILYGDTNSTLAGAIASSKLNIKIAHIESGLRSYDNKMPEEINRILTDRVSRLLFCPTQTAIENLKKEGFESFDCKLFYFGDIMLDSFLYFNKYAKKPAETKNIDLDSFILFTLHRESNCSDIQRLCGIIESLNRISAQKNIIFPIHPRTKKAIKNNNIELSKNICVIPPQGYLEMLYLIENCDFVITDSGGLQKEAFFGGKFSIVTRDESEWIELEKMSLSALLKNRNLYELFLEYKNIEVKKNPIKSVDIFGDGKCAKKIVDEIIKDI